jgi:hypothetical protein
VLDLAQKLKVWLVNIVSVLLVKVFIWIKKTFIHLLNHLVFGWLKGTLETHRLFIVESIQSKLWSRPVDLGRLWKLHLHLALVSNLVVHRIWVV